MDIERALEIGEVRSVRSNNGKTLEQSELLFSPTIIAKFVVNRETNKIDFTIDNTDLKYQDLQCSLSKSTLKDLFMNIKELYLELNESEGI